MEKLPPMSLSSDGNGYQNSSRSLNSKTYMLPTPGFTGISTNLARVPISLNMGTFFTEG